MRCSGTLVQSTRRKARKRPHGDHQKPCRRSISSCATYSARPKVRRGAQAPRVSCRASGGGGAGPDGASVGAQKRFPPRTKATASPSGESCGSSAGSPPGTSSARHRKPRPPPPPSSHSNRKTPPGSGMTQRGGPRDAHAYRVMPIPRSRVRSRRSASSTETRPSWPRRGGATRSSAVPPRPHGLAKSPAPVTAPDPPGGGTAMSVSPVRASAYRRRCSE